MKAFFAICMVALAAAEPEADPAVVYSAGYGSPLAYTAGFARYPFTTYTGAYSSPYYGNYFGGRIFKREAEAEPEADPALFYSAFAGSPFAYSAFTGYPYAGYPYARYSAYGLPGLKTYANDAIKPQNYAAKGQYVAQSAGAIHVAKRSAEADPLLYSRFGYSASPFAYTAGYAGYPYTHTTAYAGYPYNAGFLY